LLWDKERLSKSNDYYRKVHPTDAAASDALLEEERAKVEAKTKAASETKANATVPNSPQRNSGVLSTK
jgi:NADH-quinone oxidoreductase subunit I